MTARFSSPEPVEVGYTDDRIVSRVKLSIGRFDWAFQQLPVRRREISDNEVILFEFEVVDNQLLETQKEWTFKLSELHCENREMLNRLFPDCPVTVTVDAMIALDRPGEDFDRIGNMIHSTIELPALPGAGKTPEELLELEEARIQREAEVFLREFQEQNK